MIVYCKFCSSEAVSVAFWRDGNTTPLCSTCESAFELGAVYEHMNYRKVMDIDDANKLLKQREKEPTV